MKEYLLTAGPTPVPERVLLAMARPILYHRAPAFTDCLREVQEGLKWLIQTKQLPLILAGSGTSGMDAAVCNFLRTGDKAIVIRGGKFGERWGKICQAYGIECVFVDVEWGKSVEPQAVADAIEKNPGVRAVYATASETSTATKHDIEPIAKIVKATDDIILCVDAVTAVGVYDVPMDRWGLDVVCVGSQKALMLPPGLAVVAVSDKAWKANERSNLPRFYLDLMRERKSQDKGESAFTPAISLVVGLRESLRMLKEETLEGVFHRHERLAKATRAATGGLGLELLSSSPVNSVTGIRVPSGIDGTAVVKQMRTRYGITIAGGQDHLKGKIVRIAHIGYFSEFDIITAISGLEMTLQDLGFGIRPGAGVAAAQATFSETRRA
ncbi:MAG TPA: alanine--glyoxylate aminotransferase family protein [Polyangia bacterium]|nr:alanine--glyoxylate aminotransferase family protein [Polyangia bacterium]